MNSNRAVITLILMLYMVSITLAACTTAPSSPTAAPSGGSTGGSTSAPGAAEAKVQISGFDFNPTPLEIKVGTTVTWQNEDSTAHTVVADDGSFSSNPLNKGDSFSFTFEKAGSFPYHCGIHTNMKGTITVTQ
jgi:plastocyanin